MAKYQFSKAIKPGQGIVIGVDGAVSKLKATVNPFGSKIKHDYPLPPPRIKKHGGLEEEKARHRKLKKKKRSVLEYSVPPRKKRLPPTGKKALAALYARLKPKTEGLDPEEINYRRDGKVNVVKQDEQTVVEPSRPARKSSKRKRKGFGLCGRASDGIAKRYQTQIPSGTYHIINGQPVFLTRNADSDEEQEIARSASEAEETWTGMGHMARDNGSFGSIIGEDYAD